MSDVEERHLRRIERERASRKQAERLLEEKSRELFSANQALQASTVSLERQVQDRTLELTEALRQAELANARLRDSQRILKAARDAAEEASREKSHFLANMSHEIRTPMNGILGMTELALEATTDSERHEYLETVRHSTESLLRIVNDILDFSKIEAGKLMVESVAFDLHELVADTVRLLAVPARKKNLNLYHVIPDDVPERVRGDSTRLRQILLNLVGNAVKFSDQGEVVVQLQLSSMDDQDRALVGFTVSDTGVGIPAHKIGTVFEAFSQADAATTRRFGGSGLGLTITQRLVALLGGDITVDSEVGRGSTFRFWIPLAAVADSVDVAGTAVESSNNEPSEQALSPLQVLLVEDHPVNQILATRILEKWGHRVTLATNGREAVDRIASGDRFDMVLMDMQMPVMDGLQATAEVRQIEADNGWPRQPIVAMTANAMQGDRERCLEAGMDDYLSKPVRQADLADMLKRLSSQA